MTRKPASKPSAPRFVPEATPALLDFPHISTGEASRLEPMSAEEALLELAPNVLLTEPQAHRRTWLRSVR